MYAVDRRANAVSIEIYSLFPYEEKEKERERERKWYKMKLK